MSDTPPDNGILLDTSKMGIAGSGRTSKRSHLHKILKGIMIMTKEIKVLKISNRIALLEARPKENGRVVQKLKRQYRQLTGKDYAATGPETV